MALVKPVVPAIAPVGRNLGQVNFFSRGRLLSRGIHKPNDPRSTEQLSIRNAFIAGTKTYADVLSPAEQAIWDANSRFGTDGQAELTATSVGSSLADSPFPSVRAPGPVPIPPRIEDFTYRLNPFVLRLRTEAPTTSPMTQQVFFTVPPGSPGRAAGGFTLVKFHNAQKKAGPFVLETPYRAEFANREPESLAQVIAVYSFDPAIPAMSNFTQIAFTQTNIAARASAIIVESPIPATDQATIDFIATFDSQPIGAPLTLSLQASEMDFVPPEDIANGIPEQAVLIDQLAVPRILVVTMIWTTTAGESISLAQTLAIRR